MCSRAPRGAEGAAREDVPARFRAFLADAAVVVRAVPPDAPNAWQIAARRLGDALPIDGLAPEHRRALERRLVRKLLAELSRRDAEAERAALRASLAVLQ